MARHRDVTEVLTVGAFGGRGTRGVRTPAGRTCSTRPAAARPPARSRRPARSCAALGATRSGSSMVFTAKRSSSHDHGRLGELAHCRRRAGRWRRTPRSDGCRLTTNTATPPFVGVVRGHRVQDGDLAVLGRRQGRGRDLGLEHLPPGVPGGQRERVEDRLPPRRPARLGPDRADRVDQLGLARGGHPVAVLEQRDEQGPDHDGVEHGVGVLAEPRAQRSSPQASRSAAARAGTRRSTRRRRC